MQPNPDTSCETIRPVGTGLALSWSSSIGLTGVAIFLIMQLIVDTSTIRSVPIQYASLEADDLH
jgi:hypothetical protein